MRFDVGGEGGDGDGGGGGSSFPFDDAVYMYTHQLFPQADSPPGSTSALSARDSASECNVHEEGHPPVVYARVTPKEAAVAKAKRSASKLKMSNTRTRTTKAHSAKDVSHIHGVLNHDTLKELCLTTGYNRPELIQSFIRFKALCAMSATPYGIDRDTFRHAIPLLSFEDAVFVDAVFEVRLHSSTRVVKRCDIL